MMELQRRVYIDGRLQTLVRSMPTAASKPVAVKSAKVDSNKQQPFPLFDHLISQRGLKNDTAIARLLKTTPSYIGRLRNGHVPIGPKIILAVYDATGMSIEDIRSFLKDK